MTQFRIHHRTVYTYARPVAIGRHRLVLRPREGHDLRVDSIELIITPAHRLEWTWDVFGNCVAIVDFREPSDKLEIVSDVRLSRSAAFHAPDAPEPWRITYPVVYDVLETTIAAAYQAPSYPDDLDALRAWLTSEFARRDADDVERMFFDLGALIFQKIKYRRRQERGVQTPAQTLELASGSCRDMATLMMDAARALGVAARFASGYLECAAAEAGHASTHAWAEIYLPTLGWRGFDPTLGKPTSLRHVVAGVSNHPRGVMPVSGTYTGSTSDYLGMEATVKIEKIDS
ncbi:MAG TPA: transglutaminase family protein [Noviherbaspirillum sp.]|nr:transglutaminase family protein [Noviherbaspirillum sp.]